MAGAIGLAEWRFEVRERLKNQIAAQDDRGDLHPSGAQTIHDWMSDLREVETFEEVHALTTMIQERLALERQWARETFETAARLRR